LKAFIQNYIKKSPKQRIPFSEYMELALYHPMYGYYMKNRNKIGKEGDFLTSSLYSDVFASIFASVFSKTMEIYGLPPIICELGGGTGKFAKGVLNHFYIQHPNLFHQCQYLIVESSPFHRQVQQEQCPYPEKLLQFSSLQELQKEYSNFQGIVFSNEFFDAFPVEVIEKRQGNLYQVYVTVNEKDELTEKLVPLENEKIIDYLEEQKIVLKEGQRFEIPLAMVQYIRQLSSIFEKMVMFTVDYGYTNKEWELPQHIGGSLRGYYQHQFISDPYFQPGEIDLTTHIHFDALIQYGEKWGISFVQMMRQHEFLLSGGILRYLQEHTDPNPFSPVSKRNRAIRSLIMDGGISSAFHVVIQEKNIEIDLKNILHEWK
jgi:SAM-dependent MidA family methyltransferase